MIIYPDFPTSSIINQEYSDPAGPLHLCSYLSSKGIKCLFFNCVTNKEWKTYLRENLQNIGLVGISAMTDQLPSALEICKFIKDYRKDIPIVIGQIHAMLFPEKSVESNLIDYAVFGQRAEVPLEKLINFVFYKKGELKQIPNLIYKSKDGKIFKSKAKEIPFDFEKMPLIDYSFLGEKIFQNLKKYPVGMLTSRGCPYQCSFCINSVVPESRKWQAWSAERTIKEIKKLTKKGVKEIIFWDDCFFTKKARVVRIIELMEKEKINISWFANLRADHISENYIDQKFLQRLEKNGLTWISIGAESGSRRMLNLMNKQITVEQLIESARIIGKTKIIPNFSFMIGLPEEKKEDIEKTLILMKKMKEICPQAKFAGPQLYRPYPGSKFYQLCLKSGWNPPQTLEEWGEKIKKETMESDPFNLPWIEDKNFTRTAWFYSIFLIFPLNGLVKYFLNYCRDNKKNALFKAIGIIGVFLISSLGRMRMKFNFHEWQYEIKLLKKYRSALSA